MSDNSPPKDSETDLQFEMSERGSPSSRWEKLRAKLQPQRRQDTLKGKASAETQESGVVDRQNFNIANHGGERNFAGQGDILERSEGEGVKYRVMEWWHVSMLMLAETISLGVLALPSAIATVGFVPGVLMLIVFSLLATYAGFVIGQFKLRYPQVYNMADAGELLFAGIFGSQRAAIIGRKLLGGFFVLFLVFIMAAHILAFGIAMNTMTNHGTCTIVFTFLGTVICAVFCLPRTLKKVSYLSVASFVSVIVAVFIVLVSLAIDNDKRQADWQIVVDGAQFTTVILAMMNIVLAYAGNVAFFGFISELRDPASYSKALYLLQSVATGFYIVVACVIYYYCGSTVPSPALSAASMTVRKIAYGVALPTIIVAGVINGHIALKYIFMVYKGPMITDKSSRAVSWWVGLNILLWTAAWILAESIPVFNELLGVVSALLGSWFTYGMSGVLWLYLNRGNYFGTWRQILLFWVNLGMILVGAILCGTGTYASIYTIVRDASGHIWSCADNS